MASRLPKVLSPNPTARGLFLLARPGWSLLAGFTCLVALKISEAPLSTQFLLLILINMLFFAAGMATNDWFDLEIDRVNKPSRPLPSGLITERQALWFIVTLYALGILLSFMGDARLGIVSLIAFVCSFLYSKLFKRKLIVGNWLTALLCCYPFISVGVIAGFSKLIIPIATTLVFIFGREILAAVEDMPGDKANGVKSVPLWLGRENSVVASVGIMTFAIGIASLQYWMTLRPIVFWVLLSILLVTHFFLVILPSTSKARVNGVAFSVHGSAAMMFLLILGFSLQPIY